MRALVLSWVGDVLLLYPDMFLPGLIAFLAAHLCYLKLLSMDASLLPGRRALLGCLTAGALMYALLFFNGLPPDMRLPVALYVTVIALMAAQAWGRSTQLKDSGSLLAIDKFVSPLPYAALWVLATYYAAQALIVAGVLRSLREQAGRQKKPQVSSASSETPELQRPVLPWSAYGLHLG